jgi:hypothetical protein
MYVMYLVSCETDSVLCDGQCESLYGCVILRVGMGFSEPTEIHSSERVTV